MPKVLNKYRLTGPSGAVNIMRGTKWGNKWTHLPHGRAKIVATRSEAVMRFREWFLHSEEPVAVMLRAEALVELRGKDLLCCCAPAECHGDTLMEWANQPGPDGCKVCIGDTCSHLEAIKKANGAD